MSFLNPSIPAAFLLASFCKKNIIPGSYYNDYKGYHDVSWNSILVKGDVLCTARKLRILEFIRVSHSLYADIETKNT